MNTCVFVHGWGQSSQIWYQQRQHFPQATYLNLPGHGDRPYCEQWLEDIMQQCPKTPFTLIGWSLGGMLAIRLAQQYPECIRQLVLFNSTPLFCQHASWRHGSKPEWLHHIQHAVQHHDMNMMNRFFALMFHQTNISRRTYQHIARHAVDKQHPPSPNALLHGLNILEQWDLREVLTQITQPTLLIHGEQDAVIPVEASQYMAQHLPHATHHIIAGAGHAPFLTHAEICHNILESWCPIH